MRMVPCVCQCGMRSVPTGLCAAAIRSWATLSADNEPLRVNRSCLTDCLCHLVLLSHCRRQPMVPSSPLYQSSRASLLSSERIATQQQSGTLCTQMQT
jgi:hypothetical protein